MVDVIQAPQHKSFILGWDYRPMVAEHNSASPLVLNGLVSKAIGGVVLTRTCFRYIRKYSATCLSESWKRQNLHVHLQIHSAVNANAKMTLNSNTVCHAEILQTAPGPQTALPRQFNTHNDASALHNSSMRCSNCSRFQSQIRLKLDCLTGECMEFILQHTSY